MRGLRRRLAPDARLPVPTIGLAMTGGGGAAPAIQVDGTLAVCADVGSYVAPGISRINAVYIRCETPGTAGTTIVDIHLNGVTIFTVQGNRPMLAWNDPDGVAKSGTPNITALVENDVLTVEIDQVATGAEDLVVVIDIDLVVGLVGPAGAVAGAHSLLDGAAHPDTVAQVVSRGSIIVGDGTPRWNELVIGAPQDYMRSDAVDAAWSQIPAAEVVNTPAGGIAATDVQAAINELDVEKATITHKDTHKLAGADAFVAADLVDAVVRRLRETGGPTDMLLGAIANGEYLKRVGATVVGGTPAGAGGLIPADKDADGDFDPLTNALWLGNAKSTSVGTIDWNADFSVPNEATMVALRTLIKDSGAKGSLISLQAKVTTTISSYVHRDGFGADQLSEEFGLVPIAANGTSYFSITASGVNTFDIYILVVAWCL